MPITTLDIPRPPKREVAETRSNPMENPAVPLSSASAAFLINAFGGEPTAAGVPINEQTSMSLAAVYACVNVIASDVGSLPLKLYAHNNGVKSPAVDTDLYYLLTVEPNPWMTADTFFSTVTAAACLTGNGYAEIERATESGKAVALWPRHPSTTKIVQYEGELAFEVNDTGTSCIVKSQNMLHIPAMSLDGYGGGISPIKAAKQTLGLHKAAELMSARLFGNGATPTGIVTMPAGMDEVDRANAKASFEKSQSGVNQGRVAVVPQGMTFEPISISPEDMQFIATMNYTRGQIAGIFRVAPHMIGDLTKVSNSNMEAMGQEHVTFTLRSWLSKIEKEVTRKLLPTVGRNANLFSVEFDYSDLVKGNYESQIRGHATARQWGWESANDTRAAFGLNSIGPSGDVYLVPLNMVDAGKVADASDLEVQVSDQSTSLNRTLIKRMNEAYLPLFRDALGRVSAREKRDYESISRCFAPILQTIADEAIRQSSSTFRLSPEQTVPTDKILRDAVKTLEHRSSDWTPTNLDTEASAEFTKIVKSIVLGVYREAATQVVLPAA